MFWEIVKNSIYFAVAFYFMVFSFYIFFEIKLSRLYLKKINAVRNIETSGKSMAVIHAKIFKTDMDYLKEVEILEKKRKIVRFLMPFSGKTHLYKNS